MTILRKQTLFFAAIAACVAGLAQAKLPAPSDDAKAAAAVAADKAAWGNKLAAYQLCKVQDRVAAQVLAQARAAGKPLQATSTPACADPGPYVAKAAVAAAAPAATVAAPAAEKPADAAAKPAAKP